jgi:hypothetical protein
VILANSIPAIEGSEQNVSSHQQLGPPPQQNIGGGFQPGSQHQGGNMGKEYAPPKAQLGATFYPGGQDDFQMPEVVSPTPQRYAETHQEPD